MLCLDSPDWKGTQTRSQSEEPTYGWWVWSLHPRETEGERERAISVPSVTSQGVVKSGARVGIHSSFLGCLLAGQEHWLLVGNIGEEIFLAYYGTFNCKESEFGIRIRKNVHNNCTAITAIKMCKMWNAKDSWHSDLGKKDTVLFNSKILYLSLETQFKTLQVQIGFIFIHSKTLSRRTNIRTWQY